MSRGAKITDKAIPPEHQNDCSQQEKQPATDELNRSIIQMLQADGRMPYSEIANELGVSEGTIRNRVASMKKAGLLRIVAIVDPIAAEYKSDAIVGLKVAPGHSILKVSDRLAASQDVVYILWVSGRFDLLIEIVSNDRQAFLDFLDREIHSQVDISASETMSGLKNFKNQFLLKQNWP